MKLYMMITEDEHELPIAVADNVPELARMTGIKENNIYSAISHRKAREKKRGRAHNKHGSKIRYIEVEIEE